MKRFRRLSYKHLRRLPLLALAPALIGLAWTPMAHAQQAPVQDSNVLDRWDIGVGGYYATSDTTVSGGPSQGIATASINLEDDLGLDDRSVSPRIRADVLIGDHQGLSLDYYRYQRRNTRTWNRGFDWQGTAHRVDARLHSQLDFAFGSLAWRWWFGDPDNVIGLGLGASHYRVSAALEGHATLDDRTERLDESTGVSAWAPLLQVGWRHAFSPQWRMYFSGAGVFKGGGKLHGHIYNAALGLKWLPTEHLGFAVEYDINSIHIKQTHEHYRDSLDLELYGPSAFVYLRF